MYRWAVPGVQPWRNDRNDSGRYVMTYQQKIKRNVEQKTIRSNVNCLSMMCNGLSSEAAWHSSGVVDVPKCLCLIHSEISEALEGHRKGLMDDHLPNRKMFEVELADAVIRIMDLAGALNIDIGGALVEKLLYNIDRADHKPENRADPGGKKY